MNEAQGTKDGRPPAALKRAGRLGLSLLNPLSDLGVIYRYGVRPVQERVAWLQARIRAWRERERVSLTWAQAVAASGQPVARLQRRYAGYRVLWWLLMVACGGPAVILGLMLVMSRGEVPLIVLARAGVTWLLLTLLTASGFVQALAATYRLWQLQSRRVSREEKGTFRDFLAENRWCRQVLTLGWWR